MYAEKVKAASLLALRTLTLLASVPAGVLLVTLIFDPNQDAALGLLPILLVAVAAFGLLGITINHHWLQARQPEPDWLRPWYLRLVVRLAVIAALIAALLVTNPTF